MLTPVCFHFQADTVSLPITTPQTDQNQRAPGHLGNAGERGAGKKKWGHGGPQGGNKGGGQ
jgi:hypothetical protein